MDKSSILSTTNSLFYCPISDNTAIAINNNLQNDATIKQWPYVLWVVLGNLIARIKLKLRQILGLVHIM